MEKNVVNWFEIPVKDLNRAKKFYENLLGVKMQDMPMPGMEMAAFPWVQGGEYSAGAIVRSDAHQVAQGGTIVYFTCEDVAKAGAKADEIGGKMIRDKTSIGEHGFIALVQDSEGNMVGLHSTR